VPADRENGSTPVLSNESRFEAAGKTVENGENRWENGFCWVLTMGIRNAPKAQQLMFASYIQTPSTSYFGH